MPVAPNVNTHRPSRSAPTLRALICAVTLAALHGTALAQTSGTWTNTAGGTWGNSLNWSGGAVASGTGALANFSTLDITGTQTVTLDTATALGSLTFGDTATSSTGSWVITSGTTLTLAAGSGTTPRITVSGMGGGSVIMSTRLLGTSGFILNDSNTPNPGTLVLSSSNGFTGGVTVMGGSLGLGAAGAVPTVNSVVLDGGALIRSSTLAGTFSNAISIGANGGEIRNGASGQWTVGGAVTGTGSLVLDTSGFSNIVFGNASSTYTGGTRILAGSAVAVGQDAAFGSGTISFEGGSLRPTSGADRTLANPLAFAGNFEFDVASRALTFNGPATIQGATRTLTVTGTVALATFNGSIGDGGNALGFTKAGVGTLVLGGSNTYSGTTTLNAGTLRLGNQQALQNSTLSHSGTGTLLFNSGVATNAFTFGGLSASSTAATLALSNTAGTAITLTVGGNNASTAYAGSLTGAGSLGKTGAGTLTLSGSNTYGGTTTVASGTLALGNANALAGGGSLTFTGGSLQYSSSNTADLAARIVNSTSAVAIDTNNQSVTWAGNFDTSNTAGLTKSGAGRLTLTGSNGFTGLTTLASGTLALGNQQALQNSTLSHSGTGTLLFNSGVATNAFTFGGLSASSTAATLALSNTAGTAITLTVGGNNASTAYAGSLTGAGSLVKTGAGTLTLSGSNTYGGTTTVVSGKLLVNGNQSAAAGVLTVDALATLGGSGTIGGAVTVNGILSPGNSPGVLSIASLALGGSSTSLFEINGASRGGQYDGVDISGFGGLTYGGTLSLAFGNGSAFTDNTIFDLFSFTGSSSGAFSTVASTGYYAGTWTNNNDGTFKLEQGGQTLTFSQSTGNIVVVPEPAALALAGIGAGFVGWKLIRRRRSA
jgi:fibronectin-binding autotransporter adhesin